LIDINKEYALLVNSVAVVVANAADAANAAALPPPSQGEGDTGTKSDLCKKGMAILVEKAVCFETNNYKDVSTKELDVLSGMALRRRG
jgi:hypothetical protein